MSNSLKKGRYTTHSNKIGLYSNSKGSFIRNDNDVVLNFPFKDTVLEAGMSKEDVGREERFLHLDIDKKDIDTLEEPKVLTDFRYIDKDGEKALKLSSQQSAVSSQQSAVSSQQSAVSSGSVEFFDEDGNLKQNLLIKGNNLLALYTLRERLAGRVKLIYIDPPYNTGNDGFRYNDSFNHSAWLAFMKNRLEVAKDLLRKDGAIFVQCDDNEQAYLTVLMDEIFSQENRINIITVKMSEATGLKMSHVDTRLPKLKEYILSYKKAEITLDSERIKIPANDIGVNYNKFLIGLSDTELNRLKEIMANEIVTDAEIIEGDNILKNAEIVSITDEYHNWNKISAEEQQRIKIDNAYRLVRDVASASAKKLSDKKKKETQQKFFLLKTARSIAYLIKSDYNDDAKDPNIKLIFADTYMNVNPGDLWTDIKTTRVDREGSVEFLNGKKPEKLIQRIIDLTTEADDIVLDFCLGSGTTVAVAHKMSRRWIGVEQMDYIDTLAKARLVDVINGDQTGISKSVAWNGGGSFVYFELKKYNQDYIDRILVATSLSELEAIYDEMQKNAFLKFFFDKDDFEKQTDFRDRVAGKKGKELQELLDKRKDALISILDENQLYLNYADMNDTRHKVSDTEKALTDKFYGENSEQ